MSGEMSSTAAATPDLSTELVSRWSTVSNETVVWLLDEFERQRDELAQAQGAHRRDRVELDAYGSASVGEIGQERLAALLAEIKWLRGLVVVRNPSGVMVFEDPRPDVGRYEEVGGELVCRECRATLCWNQLTDQWLGRHERGCETGAADA